jgi:hypothetical protein
MNQHHKTEDEALFTSLPMAFALFTASACRNGAVPVLTYDDKERVAELRRTGKTWFIR